MIRAEVKMIIKRYCPIILLACVLVFLVMIRASHAESTYSVIYKVVAGTPIDTTSEAYQSGLNDDEDTVDGIFITAEADQ